jgi:hypothetical protein
VHAGRLEEVNELDDAVEVIWRPRGARDPSLARGPDHQLYRPRVRAGASPSLVQSLLSSGTIRPDALSLGIDIADDGRPFARRRPVDRLYSWAVAARTGREPPRFRAARTRGARSPLTGAATWSNAAGGR